MKKNGFNLQLIKKGDFFKFGEIKIRILSPDTKNLCKLNDKWSVETDKDFYVSSKVDSDYKFSIEELIKSDNFIKDNSITNLSSIAFLLEYRDKKILMLGDSEPTSISEELSNISSEKLNIDFMKVSHHGSAYNTSYELLNSIICEKYAFCTNGIKPKFPNKLCLARIINAKSDHVNFYFNYDISRGFLTRSEIEKYNISIFNQSILEV